MLRKKIEQVVLKQSDEDRRAELEKKYRAGPSADGITEAELLELVRLEESFTVVVDET